VSPHTDYFDRSEPHFEQKLRLHWEKCDLTEAFKHPQRVIPEKDTLKTTSLNKSVGFWIFRRFGGFLVGFQDKRANVFICRAAWIQRSWLELDKLLLLILS